MDTYKDLYAASIVFKHINDQCLIDGTYAKSLHPCPMLEPLGWNNIGTTIAPN